MHRFSGPLAVASCLLLAGCGESDTDPGPGGVTVGEARALDDAASMLDEQRLTAEVLEEPDQPETDQGSETGRQSEQ